MKLRPQLESVSSAITFELPINIHVGEIDPEFIDFVRTIIMDYDDVKHANFYFEDEIVKF